jgi:hypothetical protein
LAPSVHHLQTTVLNTMQENGYNMDSWMNLRSWPDSSEMCLCCMSHRSIRILRWSRGTWPRWQGYPSYAFLVCMGIHVSRYCWYLGRILS